MHRLFQEKRGCLSHYISKDMETWEDFCEPLYIAPSIDEPECPDYFEYNGKYYLIFSLKVKAHYMVSDKPFKEFVIPEDPVVPCASVPKCAEWNGKLIFADFKRMGGYSGTLTFKEATSAENSELVLATYLSPLNRILEIHSTPCFSRFLLIVPRSPWLSSTDCQF